MMKIGLALPTYNANTHNDFNDVLKRINAQSNILSTIKIFDSESTDDTVAVAMKNNIEVIEIKKKDFSHSKTRTRIAQEMLKNKIDYLILMTQDVFLQDNALEELITFIKKYPNMGVARGKQMVDLSKGNIFEFFAREQNYGSQDKVFSKKDIKEKGIDTIYTSDAFCIYNLSFLKKVDFFGESVDMSEDMLVANKLIQKGYEVGYASKAKVYHTHNYSVRDEFRRYRKIGNFYKEHDSMIKKYGKTQKKGISLALNEVKFLMKERKPLLIPESIFRNGCKFIGFQVGKRGIRLDSRGKIRGNKDGK